MQVKEKLCSPAVAPQLHPAAAAAPFTVIITVDVLVTVFATETVPE